MFLRSILFPSIVACAIGAPMVMSTSWDGAPATQPAGNFYSQPAASSNNGNGSFVAASSARPAAIQSQNAPVGEILPTPIPGQGAVMLNPALASQATVVSNATAFPAATGHQAVPAQLLNGSTSMPGMIVSGPAIFEGNVPFGQPLNNSAVIGMTPDLGAAQTLIYPGTAYGPDLTAAPMEFIPVTNLEEIIRFDVYPNWVKSRWDRVSTNPGEAGLGGLHGLRVALVTGTNTWDLHGSLTYYFDANQRAQRITFRGWTGDATRLVDLLTSKWGFRSQPTHWAGCYAAERNGKPIGGLMLQHPAVITKENPVQQVAIVLEMNNPQGSFEISNEVLGMLRYATQTSR